MIPTVHAPSTTVLRRADAPVAEHLPEDADAPREPGERCPAVDEAVSVAVAPRWTSGSRRAGRPGRSTDRRIIRFAAGHGLRPAEMPIGSGRVRGTARP